MAFKTLRESRYQDLRLVGFTNWEARTLSRIPRKTPYMKDLALERAKEFSKFTKTGKPIKEWETHIVRRYLAKNWARKGRTKYASSVYAMLRSKREELLPAYPDYFSPSKVKEKRFRKVAGDFDKQMRNIKAIYKKPGMDWDD